MKQNIRRYLVVVAFAYLLAQGAAGQDNESANHVKELSVFSSLQKDGAHSSNNALLPPYPVGMELVLTCQMVGRKTYWYEGDQQLETSDSCDASTVVHSSEYNIPKLSYTDQNRTLMCGIDGSTRIQEVKMDVVGDPVLTIRKERRAVVCRASAGFSHQLELCWFSAERKVPIKCEQSRRITLESSDVPKSQNNELRLTCMARLRSTDKTALNDKTKQIFQQMFERTNTSTTINKGFFTTMQMNNGDATKHTSASASSVSLPSTTQQSTQTTTKSILSTTTPSTTKSTLSTTTTSTPKSISTTTTPSTTKITSITTRPPTTPTTTLILIYAVGGMAFCIIIILVFVIVLCFKLNRNNKGIKDVEKLPTRPKNDELNSSDITIKEDDLRKNFNVPPCNVHSSNNKSNLISSEVNHCRLPTDPVTPASYYYPPSEDFKGDHSSYYYLQACNVPSSNDKSNHVPSEESITSPLNPVTPASYYYPPSDDFKGYHSSYYYPQTIAEHSKLFSRNSETDPSIV